VVDSIDREHLCFTSDHDLTDAVRQFVEKYQQPPENVLYASGNLWVGPVPVEDNHERT
jgi:hypothetical protein